MNTKEDAFNVVSKLIEKFKANLTKYKSKEYNEANTRREFIDEFFKALNWDMADSSEVTYEPSQEVDSGDGKTLKYPDYAFKLSNTIRFFVEAKKPSIGLNKDEVAFQIRRYCWSAHLPVSVLTDFEEFVVYDGRFEPKSSDKPSHARLRNYSYKNYLHHWDDIWSLFAKESVINNSLENLIQKNTKGITLVDEAFLRDMEKWRDNLAKNIVLLNTDQKLTSRELNMVVQSTIDRLIFLRICEDRDIEPPNQLELIAQHPQIYKEIKRLFRQADNKYNSGLFHFTKEKGRKSDPDDISLKIEIGDDILDDIISSIYYPKSPYQFDVMPADILGQVYERFLGKVIEISSSGDSRVIEKPEVIKAGGVYYTPTYIVDYIIKNTLGKFVIGKTPDDVAKLRILDPACGSGSFLIAAYQFLIDWHISFYTSSNPEKWLKNSTIRENKGLYHLTTELKKKILLNNIYGVDLDQQAVEVTKLSLLLKTLEGENAATSTPKLALERILPDLDKNIKWGNSLIATDFYNGQNLTYLDNDEKLLSVKAFNWDDDNNFGGILKIGGFDIIVGNPPYIFTRDSGIDKGQKNYFNERYKYQSDQLNTFGIFVEQSYSLMKSEGYLGFIIPNNWLTISSFSNLRQFILDHSGDLEIINVLDKVFGNANVDTAIISFQKSENGNISVGEMKERRIISRVVTQRSSFVPPHYIIQINLLKDKSSQKLILKINDLSMPLERHAKVSTGLKVYQKGKGVPLQTDYEGKNRIFHFHERVDESCQKYLEGSNVSRYRLGWSGEYLKYGQWIAEMRKSVPFHVDRLLIRQIPSKGRYAINAVFTNEFYYNDINSMVVFDPYNTSLKYLIGVINSRLMTFWFIKSFDKLQRATYPQFKVGELKKFPIPIIDVNNKHLYDNMIIFVEDMLNLQSQLSNLSGEAERIIRSQIEQTDKSIDSLVYELYRLTDDEIDLVESIQ